MKPETRLDSAVFQLTPTRTRCDLIVIANGKKEKIASGLLDPFLSHMKTARDQIEKGGYSITLEPSPRSNQTAEWFTMGTVERFVRFVSTPEVVERVNTIESEIIQIEEAIAIQGNENIGLSFVEDNQTRSSESVEGSRSLFDTDAEKAIVPYKPGAHPSESIGSAAHEENSKVQLLRVLETRKTVLQKEQCMAFARAVAAGFGMDHMAHLISFAECFGALRLREACLMFIKLWKRKHETGQWLEGMEIEAAEAMSSRSDFSSLNASGIMLSGEARKLKEFQEAWTDFHIDSSGESNGKTNNDAGADANSEHLTSGHSRDKRPPMEAQVPSGPHEYYHGHFQRLMLPQWPLHSPQGAPVFPSYPMQGMPYYQSYPGSGTFFQPPHPPMEDPRINNAQRIGKRNSVDSKDSNPEPETWEMVASNTRLQDSADPTMQLELDREVLAGREPRRKSGKTRSGKIVIRNINYITSKMDNTTGSGSQSVSSSEGDKEAEDLQSEERTENNHVRSSKKKGSQANSTDTWNSYNQDDEVYEREADSGHWKAFQNFLLRGDEECTSRVDRGTFSPDKEACAKRRHLKAGGDSILLPERDFGENSDRRVSKFDIVNGKMSRVYKKSASNDELAISREGFFPNDSQMDVHFIETAGGSRGNRRMANDEFMIYGRQNQLGITSSMSVPLSGNEIGLSDNLDKSSGHNLTDESFMVPYRSSSQDQVGGDSGGVIDMDSELPLASQSMEDSSRNGKRQASYEPDDLTMMPERGTEGTSIGYDPAIDHEMQSHLETSVSTLDVGLVGTGNGEGVEIRNKVESRKSDKEKKLSSSRVSMEKRKMETASRKGKFSKLSPLAEAQARAERLRAFKADMQKLKKEKEKEEIKRLEALKQERQKRIAARGGQSPVQSPLPSQQTRSRMPTKFSPSLQKSSKFTDSETKLPTPITKLATKTAPVGSSDYQKTSKPSRLDSTRLARNGLSKSVSSLPELKKENNSPTMLKSKPASIQTRRLSDPTGSNGIRASPLKSGNGDSMPKPKASGEPEIKKISSTMSLDRAKSATAHELRVRTRSSPSDVVQNRLTMKETVQRGKGSKSLMSETLKIKKSNEEISSFNYVNENVVIEKSVLTVEHEMSPAVLAQVSEESVDFQRRSCEDNGPREKAELVAEYVAIRAPVSPVTKVKGDQDPSERQLVEKCNSNEVTVDNARDELESKLPRIKTNEKPYQAPCAHNSSLEDPCMSISDDRKALPLSSESTKTVKPHVFDFTKPGFLKQIPDTSIKPSGKESSKGFRRLLKFRRKNHSSGTRESSMEPKQSRAEGTAIDGHIATSNFVTEVHTLKNLISQDDTYTGGNSQKGFRSFSLLLPFRGKTNDKKMTG